MIHDDPRTMTNEALEMAIAMGLEIQFEHANGIWLNSRANNYYAKGERVAYMSDDCKYRLVKKDEI